MIGVYEIMDYGTVAGGPSGSAACIRSRGGNPNHVKFGGDISTRLNLFCPARREAPEPGRVAHLVRADARRVCCRQARNTSILPQPSSLQNYRQPTSGDPMHDDFARHQACAFDEAIGCANQISAVDELRSRSANRQKQFHTASFLCAGAVICQSSRASTSFYQLQGGHQ